MSEGVRVTSNFEGVVRQLKREGKRVTKVRAQKFGLKVVAEAKAIAKAELRQDRTPDRMHGDHHGERGEGPKYVDSFEVSVVDSPRGWTVEIGNTHPAANIIEYGAQAHQIGPRDRSRLAWPEGNVNEANPLIVLPKGHKVNHPGVIKVVKPIRRAIAKLRRTQSSVRL